MPSTHLHSNGHIFSAKNIALTEVDTFKIKGESTVVTYASSDSDAQKAAKAFVSKGVKEAFYLEGGINSWIENNMPLSGEK